MTIWEFAYAKSPVIAVWLFVSAVVGTVRITDILIKVSVAVASHVRGDR
jgi:hypothetical protein